MSGERQRAQQEVLLSCLAFLLLFLFYMTCAIKLPIVYAVPEGQGRECVSVV